MPLVGHFGQSKPDFAEFLVAGSMCLCSGICNVLRPLLLNQEPTLETTLLSPALCPTTPFLVYQMYRLHHEATPISWTHNDPSHGQSFSEDGILSSMSCHPSYPGNSISLPREHLLLPQATNHCVEPGSPVPLLFLVESSKTSWHRVPVMGSVPHTNPHRVNKGLRGQ